jgi:hypothetical protein
VQSNAAKSAFHLGITPAEGLIALLALTIQPQEILMKATLFVAAIVLFICCAEFHSLQGSPQTQQELQKNTTTSEVKEQPLQEFFQTRLIHPLDRGQLQVSYISRFSKSRQHSLMQNMLNVDYGITDRWKIGIEWNAMSRRAETGEATLRGRGDLRIGTQYSFMNMRNWNFHSAVGFNVSFPTGDVEKELSEGRIEYEPYFIFARDFPNFKNLQCILKWA